MSMQKTTEPRLSHKMKKTYQEFYGEKVEESVYKCSYYDNVEKMPVFEYVINGKYLMRVFKDPVHGEHFKGNLLSKLEVQKKEFGMQVKNLAKETKTNWRLAKHALSCYWKNQSDCMELAVRALEVIRISKDVVRYDKKFWKENFEKNNHSRIRNLLETEAWKINELRIDWKRFCNPKFFKELEEYWFGEENW